LIYDVRFKNIKITIEAMKNYLKFLSVMYSLLLIMYFASCKKVVDPELTTAGVTQITQTTAQCGGTVDTDGGADISLRGVCCATNPNPNLGDIVTQDGSGLGAFTSSITGLTPNTKYYVKAYASNKQGTGYGTAMVFTTLP
jgi:hypothetical protein